MNVTQTVRLLVPITAVAFLLGCGKSEEKTPALPAVPAAAAPAAPTAPAAPVAATETAKPVVGAAATDVPTAASKEADGLIEKAKTLIASKNYTEAATALKDLANTKLTPAQQQVVDGLKTQLQKYMAKDAASEATKAAGNLLGK